MLDDYVDLEPEKPTQTIAKGSLPSLRAAIDPAFAEATITGLAVLEP
jgi:hypothetical protein